MNLNNSKYNYARKFKAILKYVLFAVPLIMVLVAVLFPIKTISNDYDITSTSTTTGTETINFNQMFQSSQSTSFFDVNYTYNNSTGLITLFGNSSTSGYPRITDSPTLFIQGHYYAKIVNYIEGSPSSNGYVGAYESNIILWGNPQDSITQAIGTGYVNIFYRFISGVSYDQSFYVNFYDLTQMFGVGNEPTDIDVLKSLLPFNYYSYNEGQDITIDTITYTNTISSGEEVLEVTEDKHLNTSLLTPMTEFYGAGINSWYESFLTAFELNYETTSYMYYLVHMPLWIMYVVLLDLLLDIVLLVPCLLHRLVYKYKGDE